MRIALLVLFLAPLAHAATCNVRDFGATGDKAQLATSAIQSAIDACHAKGGGLVLLPPGQYTSGTLHLRSNIRFNLEAGATLFASLDDRHFAGGLRAALLLAEDAHHFSVEGRGVIDGQASYEWRVMEHDDAYIRDNMLLFKAAGKPLLRSFPARFPNVVLPKLLLFVRCKDVLVTGVSLLNSRSWTFHPVACERLVIDGIYIYTSRKDGVWADGIDPDGCKDVRISNSTIDTGDDALVFYSMDWYGPALPCENITVTNCRLSSSSSALKFCDGNKNSVRRVTVSNTVITDSNRGIAFMTFDGGEVSDVVISGVTIDCRRHDWFWWGDGDPLHFNSKRRSEVDGRVYPNEPPAGRIRRVILRDIIAHGQGPSVLQGHKAVPIEDLTLDNVRLTLAPDNAHPVQKGEHALVIRHARDVTLKDVKVRFEGKPSARWKGESKYEDVTLAGTARTPR